MSWRRETHLQLIAEAPPVIHPIPLFFRRPHMEGSPKPRTHEGFAMIDALAAFSDCVADHVRLGAPLLAVVEWGSNQQVSAILWGDGIAVTSEQSLPECESYTVVLPGGARVTATPVGRDATTNVAALRVESQFPPLPAAPEVLSLGALVLALGGDGTGSTRVRMGVVETLGPSWQSQCGGRIDQLIRLDINLGRAAEGGPVFDARGALIGMSTFGPRNQVLVIPHATIARVVAQLAEHGRVARGWLGVGVQPVLIPGETGREAADKGCPGASGLMVMSIDDRSPAFGMLMTGDILLSAGANGLPTPRALFALLGEEAIGSTLALHLLRGGTAMEMHVEITARPA
jgi:S1-C subfamily serine protease